MTLPTKTFANTILAEHRAALKDAESAVQHARRCGDLLLEARQDCGGKWLEWLAEQCMEIPERTAQRYMQLARHPEIEAKTVNEAILKLAGSPKPTIRHARRIVRSEDATEPQAVDSTQDSTRDATARQPAQQSPPERGPDMPEEGAAPEDHEAEQLEAALKEQDAAVERVLGGAGTEELKRQAAEIAALKSSRDSFMNGKATNERLLAAANRKVDRLKARVKELEAENEALRERLAVVQEQKDAA